MHQECLERTEPDINSLLNGKILRYPRDDHDGSAIGGHILELSVLSEEEQLFACEALPDLKVGNSPLIELNDMLNVVTISAGAMIEWQREILIEQNLHEATLTAGGR